MVKLTVEQVRSTKEFQMIKITDKVREAVEKSGVRNGLVAVITAHTTTGIMTNESLECVEQDIEETLERLIPRDVPYRHAHFLPSYGTTGGNSPGHLKSMLAGNHCLLPVVDGKMYGGHAQDIYFVEFDGVKPRKYFIQVMGEE
jgi:secondary thiamine-phosphate synthase enzyme